MSSTSRPESSVPSKTSQEGGRSSIAFVVPLYNEADVVGRLISEIEDYRSTRPNITEVVLVDDGSTDRTATLVRDATDGKEGYTLLSFSRNFGHQLAISAGLHMVKADAAVVMDADLQDPLLVIDAMAEKWHEGYDAVYGVRRAREGDSGLRKRMRHAFYVFFRKFTELDAPLDAGDFRLLGRPVIEAFRELNEQQPYVRGLVSWLGFNQIGVEYDRPDRLAGKSKYPLKKLIKLGSDGLTSFSNKPLKYAVRVGLTLSILSVLGLIWAVVTKLVQPDLVPGWASLVFVAFFFGGLQLLFLGIVGAYLGRVYEEVKARPRYIIRDVWNSEGESDSGA